MKTSEPEYRALMEHASDAIIISDLAGKILDVNVHAEKLLGYTKKELVELHVQDIHPVEDHQNVCNAFKDMLEKGTSLYEHAVLTKNGAILPVEVAGTLVDFANNKVVLGIYRDITERKNVEQSLARALSERNNIFESIPDIIYTLDTQGRLTDWNSRLQQVIGLPPEELKGRHAISFFLQEYQADVIQVIQETLRNGYGSVEARLELESGENPLYRFTGATIKDTTGNIIGLTGVGRDITLEKQAEQILKKTNEELEKKVSERTSELRHINRKLTEEINRRKNVEDSLRIAMTDLTSQHFALDQHAIVAITDKKGIITFVNSKFCELSGYSADDLIGQDHRIVNSGYHPKSFFKEMWKTIGQGTVWHGEIKNRNKGGGYYWVYTTIVPFMNARGKPEQYIAIRTDITKRKKVEEALRESQSRFKGITEIMSDWVWEIDADGKYTYCSEKAQEILGYHPDEIIGKSPFDFMPADEAARVLEKFSIILQQQQPIRHLENWNITKDGRRICLLTNGIPLIDNNGKLTGYVGVDTDITKRKNYEQMLKEAHDAAIEAAGIKTQFLANVSHELRTPLNAIIGYSEILQEEAAAKQMDDIAADLTRIHKSGKFLLTLINNVLDLSKIEAGKLNLEKINFNLSITVKEVIDLFAIKSFKKGVNLYCLINPNVPAWVRGDPTRLKQILSNLVGNALKFTEQGEIFISVAQLKRENENILLRFDICDTGIGVDNSAKRIIFEAFSQADGSTTRKYGGTGLGLTICKQLAESMGGEIGLESELGKGSQFWFTALLGVADIITNTPPLCDLRKERVLIIDSHESGRKILQQYLASWDMDYITINTELDVLNTLYQAIRDGTPYTILFVDETTVNKAIDLARKIKSDRAFQGLYLILISPRGRHIDKNAAVSSGFNAVLSKPFLQFDLQECFYAILRTETNAKKFHVNDLQESKVNSRRAKILVVEDIDVNQELMFKLLTKLECDCEIAGNGIEALQKCRLTPFDLIFMDCQMPELDGYAATVQIRTQQNSNNKIPIIAMTALSQQDKTKCLAAGMDDYLSKPFSLDSLKKMLNKWLPLTVIAPEIHAADIHFPAANVLNRQHLDTAKLAELKELMGEDFYGLLDTYLSGSQDRIDALQAAVQNSDIKSVIQAAHSLKGTSSNLGALYLAKLCDELARQAQQDKNNNLIDKIDLIVKEYQEVRASLQTFYQEYISL